MKKKNKIYFAIAVILLVIIGVFLIGKYYVSLLAEEVSKLPSGEDAIEAMSPVEKEFLQNNILKIGEHMTSNEVEQILGARSKIGIEVPFENGQRRIDDWLCPEYDILPNGFNCLIKGYFVDDKIVAVKWLKLDHFFYEIKWEGY
ncbi:hypothetical protein KY331_05995 [Candidatus Woesearchaeota archaeon]|nr:hypothetical protein [Candidatus Woesearchaeota archaeon]